jgi:hypothetical protein
MTCRIHRYLHKERRKQYTAEGDAGSSKCAIQQVIHFNRNLNRLLSFDSNCQYTTCLNNKIQIKARFNILADLVLDLISTPRWISTSEESLKCMPTSLELMNQRWWRGFGVITSFTRPQRNEPPKTPAHLLLREVLFSSAMSQSSKSSRYAWIIRRISCGRG